MKRYLATMVLSALVQQQPQQPSVLTGQELQALLSAKDEILNQKLVQLVQYETMMNQLNNALKTKQDEIEKLKKESCKQ